MPEFTRWPIYTLCSGNFIWQSSRDQEYWAVIKLNFQMWNYQRLKQWEKKTLLLNEVPLNRVATVCWFQMMVLVVLDSISVVPQAALSSRSQWFSSLFAFSRPRDRNGQRERLNRRYFIVVSIELSPNARSDSFHYSDRSWKWEKKKSLLREQCSRVTKS